MKWSPGSCPFCGTQVPSRYYWLRHIGTLKHMIAVLTPDERTTFSDVALTTFLAHQETRRNYGL